MNEQWSDDNPYQPPSGEESVSDIMARRGNEDLSTGDWLLCIFCSGIACIVGIVRLIQGKPNGGKMIGMAIVFSLIWGIVRAFLTVALRQ